MLLLVECSSQARRRPFRPLRYLMVLLVSGAVVPLRVLRGALMLMVLCAQRVVQAFPGADGAQCGSQRYKVYSPPFLMLCLCLGGASAQVEGQVEVRSPAVTNGQQAMPQAKGAATHGRTLLADSITVSGGSWHSEIGWSLSCSDGASLSGDAPFTSSLNVAMGATCTLTMTDSYGDGWNGAVWEGFQQSFTLADGLSFGTETFIVGEIYVIPNSTW